MLKWFIWYDENYFPEYSDSCPVPCFWCWNLGRQSIRVRRGSRRRQPAPTQWLPGVSPAGLATHRVRAENKKRPFHLLSWKEEVKGKWKEEEKNGGRERILALTIFIFYFMLKKTSLKHSVRMTQKLIDLQTSWIFHWISKIFSMTVSKSKGYCLDFVSHISHTQKKSFLGFLNQAGLSFCYILFCYPCLGAQPCI